MEHLQGVDGNWTHLMFMPWWRLGGLASFYRRDYNALSAVSRNAPKINGDILLFFLEDFSRYFRPQYSRVFIILLFPISTNWDVVRIVFISREESIQFRQKVSSLMDHSFLSLPWWLRIMHIQHINQSRRRSSMLLSDCKIESLISFIGLRYLPLPPMAVIDEGMVYLKWWG